MRELKFRVWDKSIGMSESCSLVDIGIMAEEGLANLENIMQFTGLHDKNGTEIYEGDILKYTFDNPDSIYANENGLKVRINKVFWQEWRSSFALGSKMANNDLFNYVRNGNRVEVIGNIHDNPELLNEVKS